MTAPAGPQLTSMDWRKAGALLILMNVAMAVSLNGWMALLNNFVVEKANFTGQEIGFLQGIREIPGFLSFAVIFVVLVIREQRLAWLALVMLGIGTALTGFFPAVLPLYLITFVASMGFHYYEAINQSLTLQWIPKNETPQFLGRMMGAAAGATALIYLLIMLTTPSAWFGIISGWVAGATDIAMQPLDLKWLFLLAGGFTVVMAVGLAFKFPQFQSPHQQNKKLLMRKRYWLFYALTFFSGARRQIFVVFAAFMMVEKFGFNAAELTLLFLINHIANVKIAPLIGRLVHRWGERRCLLIEYAGLIVIFTSYAFVDVAWLAAALYILDHIFFAFAIAVKSYFQKIADPADLASSAGVSFTINHIAAVIIPPIFGILWLTRPEWVFLAGAGLACCSFILSLLVPRDPDAGQEVTLPAPLFRRKLAFGR